MSTQAPSRREFVTALDALGVIGLTAAFAAPDQQMQQTPTATPEGFKSKQGSWFAELTTEDGRTFRGFSTFTPNGGMMTTGQGDYREGSHQGTGHGRWVQEGRRVDAKILKFVFDEEGALAAIKEEFSTGEMDETGDAFVGTTTVNTYDLDGNLIETRTGTINSRRITLEAIFGT